MKKLLLALSSVCLIPTNTLVLIGCNADQANQDQTVKNNINNFLSDSNESDKLKLDKSNINKLNSFGITCQNDQYQFDNNSLTIDAIKNGLNYLINSDSQLPLIFNVLQILLETQAAENETALFVENQGCDINGNNLIYKWNISSYIHKFKNDEFEWIKINQKQVELYVEIIDCQQVINEEVKTENPIQEEVNPKENNQLIAKEYKEIISRWNEDALMLTENKIDRTVADLVHAIKSNGSFHFERINEQTLNSSIIKLKDVNTQIYLQETDKLLAEKFIIEIEFNIGEADLQVTEVASFEIRISDYNDQQQDNKTFECETHQTDKSDDDYSDSKIPPTDKLDDSGIESDLDVDKDDVSQSDHDIHVKSDPVEITDCPSDGINSLTIYVSEKTKVEEVIRMIKVKNPLLAEANITLKDNKNKKVSKTSDIKFNDYYVYQDKITLVLKLQVEELILTSTSEQIDEAIGADIFNTFDDINLDKLMAQYCSVKDLKDMIKVTDQFNTLKSQVKNGKVTIKIKDKDMNEIEDNTKLIHDQYYVEILAVLKENNTKINITFTVDVPTLSVELSSQLSKYVDDIKAVRVSINTKKDSTDDRIKCEDKIRNSEAIKNIFKADKKVLVEQVEILDQAPYTKGITYKARLTFCFDKYENASRRQIELSFIVE